MRGNGLPVECAISICCARATTSSLRARCGGYLCGGRTPGGRNLIGSCLLQRHFLCAYFISFTAQLSAESALVTAPFLSAQNEFASKRGAVTEETKFTGVPESLAGDPPSARRGDY